MNFEKILEENQQWIEEHLRLDPNYFDDLAKGQSPDILYIGCSDSRVTAEEMMGARPGEVFVHRNIANVIANSDLNVMSVVNYAVQYLKVQHIVVCGHYYCGGVKAAMESTDMGIINLWLRNIQDVYRLHKDELNAIADEETRYKRLVELNVQEQCVNLLKTIDVQQAFRERGLIIHGWVFDVKTGRLIDLKIDFAKILKGLSDIYTYEL
ncbi:MAG TPA: carbonic anhydrase [Cyclobacteriaceae bacterium]|nr:carbonic anhydrase [Cyclobacteriaceae bacterium]HMV10169.1 carbonic anhydrase [Cyclobacteriaceae bacterium]HMV91420.1 carbonic anhydrase [Cyclobacteriaceae bacterium]HMX01506.1 carbonic anhydrase [Cyclobacteriaceae bacterium]HMX51492.1 carbonic anhydrase [Cyclobacteriaceae bacterium]